MVNHIIFDDSEKQGETVFSSRGKLIYAHVYQLPCKMLCFKSSKGQPITYDLSVLYVGKIDNITNTKYSPSAVARLIIEEEKNCIQIRKTEHNTGFP